MELQYILSVCAFAAFVITVLIRAALLRNRGIKALYDDAKRAELMANEGIIRNRLKINAVITNAKLFLEIVEKYGSFEKFIWGYVDNKPIVGHWETFGNMPATTPISDKISKDLKKMGFKFVGSTIIYSFMQATGMVNDHLKDCFVYKEMLKEGLA